MVEEPSHVKQLSPNHVCKIGLKGPTVEIFVAGIFTPIRPALQTQFDL
jgi:hypothetical protein